MTGQFLQGLASCVPKIKIVYRHTDRPTPTRPRGAFAPKNKYKIQDDLFRIHLGYCSIQDNFRILGCLFRIILNKQACSLVSEASKLSSGARIVKGP